MALVAVGCATAIAAGLACVPQSGSDEERHTVHPQEGGEWDFGSSAGRTWSNFLHQESHASTVRGHAFVDTGCVHGGDWARARAPPRWIPGIPDAQDKRLC
ncbi:lactococcin 972 family bacteriocin [Corynebacterium frankenforstense]